MQTLNLSGIPANSIEMEKYGHLIGQTISQKRLPIPFYDHVDEGENLPFEYTGNAVIRTARIHPTDKPVIWLERHMNMTQLIVGLGQESFAMVLGLPNNETLPAVEDLKCFVFSPGTGILLHRGTWHDFPIAIEKPVTCLTANSEEMIEALTQRDQAGEIDAGDVFKIDVPKRLKLNLTVSLK